MQRRHAAEPRQVGDGRVAHRPRTPPVRIVLQRVSRAEVRIGGRVTGRIATGFLILVGLHPADTTETLRWMADKVISLRLFPDDEGRMNRGLEDVSGGILVVSQFTLYGDARKGRRPSFIDAAPPEIAIPLYDRFIELLRERAPGPVETGAFGAMMDVELVNDGPVTLILER
ncbi:MAG TPA: D-aminoacyl-tRNA deacylase [Longimicrobiales bacterium]